MREQPCGIKYLFQTLGLPHHHMGRMHPRKKVYNQIDYILLRASRKYSMRNSRSYNIFRFDTDHRLVLTSLWRKNDFERCKSLNKPKIKEENNQVIKDLKMKKKKIKEKMPQTKNPEKIEKLKKERTRSNNCLKRRIGFLVTRAMLKESKDIMQAKDNAQSSLAIKNIITKKT